MIERVGWRRRLSLLHTVPGGLCWAGDLIMAHRKAFFSFRIFFFFWLHIHRRPRTFMHLHYMYPFLFNFYICNVDGMLFKFQMRAPSTYRTLHNE